MRNPTPTRYPLPVVWNLALQTKPTRKQSFRQWHSIFLTFSSLLYHSTKGNNQSLPTTVLYKYSSTEGKKNPRLAEITLGLLLVAIIRSPSSFCTNWFSDMKIVAKKLLALDLVPLVIAFTPRPAHGSSYKIDARASTVHHSFVFSCFCYVLCILSSLLRPRREEKKDKKNQAHSFLNF